MARTSILGRFLAGFLPHEEPRKPTKVGLETVERNLAQLMREAREKAEVTAAQAVADEKQRLLQARPEEQWARDREALAAQMKQDVLAMHERLQTGLDATLLARAADHVRDTLARTAAPTLIEERIDDHVGHFLYDRCGELAWTALGERMVANGVQWPVSPDIYVGHEPDQVQRLIERHHAEIRGVFLCESPRDCIGMMVGDVVGWKFVYPSRGSALWDETVRLGTGSGLRAALLTACLELWQARPASLNDEMRDALAPVMSTLREVLEDGVVTADEMRQVESVERHTYGSALPRLVWAYIEKTLPTLGTPAFIDLVKGEQPAAAT